MSPISSGKALQLSMAVPGQNLESYISCVHSVAILTHEQEKSLAERFFYHQDVDAARQLVLAHLRFVVHIARSYSGYGLPQSDLIQEGNVGLMKAVKRFDPTFGVRLVSFAVHWIKAEIHEFVLKNWRIVKVATTKAQRKLFFNLRSAKKRLALLTQTEAAAVAKDLGVEKRDVLEMEGRLLAHDLAFDPSPSADEESAKAYVPAYFLEDHSQDPAATYEQTQAQSNGGNVLTQALQLLDERSRDILKRRWLSDKKATLHELADEYKVSAERIRQLEKNAFKKIKSNFSDFQFA